jgi:DNA-binding transcriptional regulator GbsR (MarR family)
MLSVIKSIRGTLREIPDGMTLEELSELLNRPKSNVRKVLKAMPDVYIDRWEVAPRGQYKAVWCVVIPPTDCPRPDGKKDDA